VNDMLLEQI